MGFVSALNSLGDAGSGAAAEPVLGILKMSDRQGVLSAAHRTSLPSLQALNKKVDHVLNGGPINAALRDGAALKLDLDVTGVVLPDAIVVRHSSSPSCPQ